MRSNHIRRGDCGEKVIGNMSIRRGRIEEVKYICGMSEASRLL
jgi:hypothetical protein